MPLIRKHSLTYAAVLCAALMLFPLFAQAQDTRQVTEPHIPRPCTVLDAKLSAPQGKLSVGDELREDTARLQAAINACPAGKAVELRAAGKRRIFLTGPISLRPGVTLLIDRDTELLASRNPRDYDLSPGSCGVVNKKGHGCKPLISANHAPGSGVMGEGVIDGRGGAKLLKQNVTWWGLAHEAKVTNKQQSCPRILVVDRSNGFTLYRITLRNSPNFHVAVNRTDGFTAWGVKIFSPKTARNTDGIDPGSSRNVTIAYSYIHTGDDQVAIKSSPSGPASHISILHDHFYTGHGISIGSGTDGGVDHVLVRDLTIDGADNGIRIKSDRSRGGLVHEVAYEDVCIRNTKNPILITPYYADLPGNRLPVYQGITLKNVHVLTPGKYTFFGLDPAHPLKITLNGVWAEGLDRSAVQAKDAEITIGTGGSNLVLTGLDVHEQGTPRASVPPDHCATRFVPFPSSASANESAAKSE